MPHGGENLLQQVPGGDAQAGGVDAGVTAEIFALQNVLVHEKLYLIVMVVHQAQHTDGAGGDVQVLLHILRRGEGQPGGADLLAEDAGLEYLAAGEHQQVEGGALAVAQEQVFADGGVQHLVDGGAGLHGHGGVVVDALVGNA